MEQKGSGSDLGGFTRSLTFMSELYIRKGRKETTVISLLCV